MKEKDTKQPESKLKSSGKIEVSEKCLTELRNVILEVGEKMRQCIEKHGCSNEQNGLALITLRASLSIFLLTAVGKESIEDKSIKKLDITNDELDKLLRENPIKIIEAGSSDNVTKEFTHPNVPSQDIKKPEILESKPEKEQQMDKEQKDSKTKKPPVRREVREHQQAKTEKKEWLENLLRDLGQKGFSLEEPISENKHPNFFILKKENLKIIFRPNLSQLLSNDNIRIKKLLSKNDALQKIKNLVNFPSSQIESLISAVDKLAHTEEKLTKEEIKVILLYFGVENPTADLLDPDNLPFRYRKPTQNQNENQDDEAGGGATVIPFQKTK